MNATSFPRKAFYVRKRWDGSRVCLIHLTDLLVLDERAEAVWDLADGTRTVLELIVAVGRSYPEHERPHAPQEIAGILIELVNAGMMELCE